MELKSYKERFQSSRGSAQQKNDLFLKIFTVILVLFTINFLFFYSKIETYLAREKAEKENMLVLKEAQNFEIKKGAAVNVLESVPQNTYSIIDSAKSDTSLTDTESNLIIAKVDEIITSHQFTAKGLISGTFPKSAFLNVPFFCQAPLQTVENWKFHEESCEEAAVLQSYLFITDKTMTKAEANTEILNMIKWQEENFGGHHDIYADEVKKFIEGFYNIPDKRVVVIKNATIDNLKNIIAKGYPIIVPITGEILKNPNYPYPGYHMLVVIGYTENRIITNDNGTRKGEGYSYDISRFEKAMNDAGANVVVILP